MKASELPVATTWSIDGFDHLVDTYKTIADKIIVSTAPRSIIPDIERVIFNDPATIIIWQDGTKTVVKCGGHDWYDPEKGLAMAICKKVLGNRGNYNNVFRKYLPKGEKHG